MPRVKRVQVSESMIKEFFIKTKRESFIRVIEGIPEDSRFVRAYYDPRINTYFLIFESEEFEEVIEGAAIPDFFPIFERIDEGVEDAE